MSKIFEDFKNKSEIIKLYDWMKVNKNLINFDKYQVSVNASADLALSAFNIDSSSLILNLLVDEVNQDFIRRIIKKLFDTNKFDYLDLRPDGSLMTGRHYLEKLVSMILNSGYKNVVTTGLIASELQDSQFFNPTNLHNTSLSKTSTFYTAGKLSDVNIWVDPYMRFNDGRLCLFNTVDINVDGFDLKEVIPAMSITPRLTIEYNFDFLVSDSKLIFVIEDENSEAYKQYKSLQRDIKIDNILDGETL